MTIGLLAARSAGPRDIVAVARPWFWPVSLLPYAVGVVLATHRLVPAADRLPRLTVGALVAGPLVWLAVLAVNDAHDLAGDLRNPRKAGSPLVSGRVSPRLALRLAGGASVAAFLLSLAVGTAFAVGTALALVLGWLYSAPPVRLKTRPGADVAVNALGIGALGPLAGWTAVHPLGGFPWVMAVQGTLVGVALYVPTTLFDHAADVAGGYDTIAVRLGPARTYLLGLGAWVAAAGWSVLLAVTGTVIPHRMAMFELVLVPGLIGGYHALLGRTQSLARIAVVSVLFLLPSVAFVLTYTGH